MDTQEAQTLVNNWKGSKDDPKYLEAKDFLENQQKEGEKAEKKKSLKEKLVMTPEEMQKMTSERQDVKTGARRSMVANPAVGVVDRVMGNVTGRNEDLFDPLAFKDKDLNADGSIKEKDLQLGNGTSGNFIGAEEKEGSKGGNGGSGSASNSKLDKATQSYLDINNAIQNTQEDKEYDRQGEELEKRWNARLANADKMSRAMKNIDDHMVEQLPTFMFKRYQNGEFGDPKSSDAKLRLAHFMINGVGTALSNMSHVIRKDGVQEQSDAEKYQQTNLEQGLQNRWNKYKQETQSAIDLAKEGGMSEEKITDSIATISSNNRLQSAFNQMNERQKVFALQVLGEIGGKMGNMNDAEFANTLIGMSAMGQDLDYKEAAGMLIYRFIKDPEKRDATLKELGFNPSNIGKSLLNK